MVRIVLMLMCFAVYGHRLQAQGRFKADALRFTVEEAADWTGLFKRSNGWFGGDGIFSIPLNGKEQKSGPGDKTLFIFSDSMIGKNKEGKLQPGSVMLHNTIAVLSGHRPDSSSLKFYYPNNGKLVGESVFEPGTQLADPNEYYWLGDGFINHALNNKIFIFGYRVKSNGKGAFGFKETGNCLISIEQKDLDEALADGPAALSYNQKDTPFYFDEDSVYPDSSDIAISGLGSFGAGIYVNTKESGAKNADGYIYIYGVLGKDKALLAARVLPGDFEKYIKWTFWDGTTWTSDMQKARVLTKGVSNELSVSALPNGKFVLVYQQEGIGRFICMRVGESPYGPFGPEIKLWDCTPALTRKTYFSYNAKAHPSLSGDNELLISYNVNSFDFFKDLETDPQLYRPRFIRLKFE